LPWPEEYSRREAAARKGLMDFRRAGASDVEYATLARSYADWVAEARRKAGLKEDRSDS
jgi:ribosome-binding protein aMBF1 (putative translation factor)